MTHLTGESSFFFDLDFATDIQICLLLHLRKGLLSDARAHVSIDEDHILHVMILLCSYLELLKLTRSHTLHIWCLGLSQPQRRLTELRRIHVARVASFAHRRYIWVRR